VEPLLSQSPLQFGFTKGVTPILATLALTEIIGDAMDSNKLLCVVSLDIRKGFDIVVHNSLPIKLFFQMEICILFF
jgi:hypothetical protein